MNKEREFNDNRIKMNQILLASENVLIRRIFYPDSTAPTKGQLIHRINEFIQPAGFLLTSYSGADFYHPEKYNGLKFNSYERVKTLVVSIMVYCMIMMPILRREANYWDKFRKDVSERP